MRSGLVFPNQGKLSKEGSSGRLAIAVPQLALNSIINSSVGYSVFIAQ